MSFAGKELLHYWNSGHASGFFGEMAWWTLAGILANLDGPQLPFEPPRLGIPPREGMDFYLAAAAPRYPLSSAK